MGSMVFDCMVACHNSRNKQLMDGGLDVTVRPSMGIYKICLGRQMGHTWGITRFMNLYHGRCVVVTSKEQMKTYMVENFRVDEPDHIITLHNAQEINKLSWDMGDMYTKTKYADRFANRDIIIVDMSSWVDSDIVDEFKSILSVLADKPTHSIYYIQ